MQTHMHTATPPPREYIFTSGVNRPRKPARFLSRSARSLLEGRSRSRRAAERLGQSQPKRRSRRCYHDDRPGVTNDPAPRTRAHSPRHPLPLCTCMFLRVSQDILRYSEISVTNRNNRSANLGLCWGRNFRVDRRGGRVAVWGILILCP